MTEVMPDVAAVDLSGLPAGFVWGAATAAFQVEGDAAGRGESIWDEFCRRPGAIADGSDGKVTCDQVNRYPGDVELMARLGIGAYRFSIAWPRVQPGGHGPFAPAGIAYYDRLVDGLLDSGVEPWVTLYHWDLPSELQQDGGWSSREIVDRFTEYAVGVHAALADRVRVWGTVNEPWCVAWLGYGAGYHAPGINDYRHATRAAHHILLAHARATRALREQDGEAQIGLALNTCGFGPAAHLDAEAARAVGEVAHRMDGLQNRWWLDGMFHGRYPEDTLQLLGAYLDDLIHEGDLDEIQVAPDYIGVNYYHEHRLVPTENPNPYGSGPYPGANTVRQADPGPDATSMDWAVTPGGLRDTLLRVGTDYPAAPPLVVTENGSAYADDPRAVGPDGCIEDPRRVAFLRSHVAAIAEAARAGADVQGYFVWSLLDNFEWTHGFTQRFGLVRVDQHTQARTPKRSAQVYSELIAAHRAATGRRRA